MPILKVIFQQPEYMAAWSGERKYWDGGAVESVISYCLNPEKTKNFFVGGMGINLRQAAYEINKLAEAYGKDRGLRLRHMVLSFSEKEMRRLGSNRYSAYQAVNQIAQVAISFYGNEYQILYAVHEDSKNCHVHIVMSTVNFRTGYKYAGTKSDYYAFQGYLKEFLEDYYGLRLITVKDQ